MQDNNQPIAAKSLCIGVDSIMIDAYYEGQKVYDMNSHTNVEAFYLELFTIGDGMNLKVHVPVKDLKYIIQNLQDFQKDIEAYKESNNG